MRRRSGWVATLGAAMLLAGAPEAPAGDFDWAGGFGLGVDQKVTAEVVFNDGSGDALYAGDSFTTAAGVPANHIAKWNGTNWAPLGNGMNGAVYALAVPVREGYLKEPVAEDVHLVGVNVSPAPLNDCTITMPYARFP
jgi:hypothetical protein